MPVDPTSTEESTPWDPITGKLRAHANLKLPKGTRDALSKHVQGFDDTRGLSSTSTRCPTTAATSACTTAPGSPRRALEDTLDLTQPARGALKKTSSQTRLNATMNRSSSVPRPPDATACGSGKRAVRFLADQRSPQRSTSREKLSAMQHDPGRYDVNPDRDRSPSLDRTWNRQGSNSSMSSTARAGASMSGTANGVGKFSSTGTEWRRDNLGAAMRSDIARYDVAPRGSKEAREYEEKSRHLMHVKADPRKDMLNDGSGHNADADGQTMMGIEIHERFHDMRTAFLKIDTDYDGRITHEELMEACLDWNVPLSEATRVMNCTDLDNKGYIDFDEFAQHFNPALIVSEDDEELLRLYQEGIMGNEQPIKLGGVTHGTSSASPLVDETKHYRDDNQDLRGRLARAMGQIEELNKDLKASREHAASLQVSLDDANDRNAELTGRNSELEGRNAKLRKMLDEADEDRRRMARELENSRGRERDYDDDDTRRRTRTISFDEDEEERRRLARALAEAEAERDAARRAAMREQDDVESKTVFIYGIDGCQKTAAMCQALDKAKVPYVLRDFNKDKRFLSALKKSGCDTNSVPVYAPVVCLGDKAWWKDHEETEMIPFPQAVALELRRELGLNIPAPDKVREDIDIDTEIYERYLSMQDAFLKLDDNKDGFITQDELEQRCLQWNIPTREAQRVIAEADRDGKGCLDFDEFAKRFGGLWNSRCRGPLKGLAPMPNSRPSTGPIR